VATVGTIRFKPNVVNCIPAFAEFTIDLRDPSEEKLAENERKLEKFLKELERRDGVTIETRRLARFEPVVFDEDIVMTIEEVAAARQLSCRRITSGAGHDAQMMSRLCPTAMIFVPSRNGISHNPLEHTDDEALIAGAQVLLDTVCRIVMKD
jgi:N-carbamoyl-L-amino-acid hydrolase